MRPVLLAISSISILSNPVCRKFPIVDLRRSVTRRRPLVGIRPFSTKDVPKPRAVSPPTSRGKLRRFYNSVTVAQDCDETSGAPVDHLSSSRTPVGWSIQLDGRPLKTPAGNPFRLPNEKIALLVASEWDLQSDFVKFELMPLTNLAIQTLDLIAYGDVRLQVEADILKYLQTDVTLVRVPLTDPQTTALATQQRKQIDPILRSVEQRYGLEKQLAISDSLTSPKQHQPDLDLLASILKRQTNWELACLFTAVRNLKSYLLGISLLDGSFTVPEVCQVAALEESYQQDRWGLVEGAHDVENATVEMWLNAAVSFHYSLGTQ